MFKKIVTEIAYSPALAGELTSYMKRLRQERNKRQIGLIFISVALVVQLFAGFYPPEPANANNPLAFIEGGAQSTDEYLRYYDQNTEGVKDLFASLGITRGDIQAASEAEAITSSGELLYWTLTDTATDGMTPYTFSVADGHTGTAYYQTFAPTSSPLSRGGSAAYVSSSASIGWFALLKDSGNLVTRTVNSPICSLGNNQAPNEQGDTIECRNTLVSDMSAYNLTADTPATSTKAAASDRVIYTLSVKNTGDTNQTVPLRVGMRDILEYARLLDKGGGEFDEQTKILAWPNLDLPPKESVTRSFIVKLSSSLPATARGKYVASSYDCTMTATFGGTVEIPVACPLPKTIEQIISNLPSTTAVTGMTFMLALTVLAAYFYVRSRQLLAELRHIQHSHLGSL